MNNGINPELTMEMLPNPSDRNAVYAFAMSFNGYLHFGSLEQSVEMARRKTRNSMSEIRNELFFSARSSKHRDDDSFLDSYQELLPTFRAMLLDKAG